MAKRIRASRKPDFLAALIRTAYFPRELPPVFTTRYFSDFCRDQFTFIAGVRNTLAETTRYDTYTAPRVTGGRRNLAVVHPIAQVHLSLEITDHRTEIKKLISRNSRSLYRTHENMAAQKAFEGLDFRAWEVEGEKIRAG